MGILSASHMYSKPSVRMVCSSSALGGSSDRSDFGLCTEAAALCTYQLQTVQLIAA